RPSGARREAQRSLTGLGELVRLVLRRDRVRLALWVGALVALMAVSAAQVRSLYASPAAIASYVAAVEDNPALVTFSGPGYGFDRPNTGVILVNETSLWMALGCALMSLFLVVRHTRAEEESERADLVRSGVVGRHAGAAAVLAVALAANTLVGIGAAGASIALGYGVAGSVALAASFAAVGWAFAGAAAVAAQVVGASRAALGLGAAAVGAAFVGRGVSDVSAPALSWLSPFGWGIGVRAFAGERWWTLVGLAALGAALAGAAFALSVRCDLGSGLAHPRAGRSRAPGWITHPLGLALLLQRGALIGWTVGVFVTGLLYGSVADDIESLLADNPQLADYLAQLGGASVTDAYLATSFTMLALLASGFAVSSALRNRSEEAAGFAESMLATPLSRWRWALDHLVVTVAGAALVVSAGGLGVGLGYAAAVGDAGQVGRLTASALATLPAVLTLVGVAAVLFGWAPRAAAAAWAALAAVVVVGVFGELLRLPSPLRNLSPLEQAPARPAEPWRITPLVLLSLVSLALMAFGLLGFRRRDLAVA
ncbi:MAG: ABC transporter permease, partial [Acidimicrobiales bacterium]